MEDLKGKIRKIINNPPTKRVKCNCGGYDIVIGHEPDGPNASDWGNAIYGKCCNGTKTVEDTNKMIDLIAKLLILGK